MSCRIYIFFIIDRGHLLYCRQRNTYHKLQQKRPPLGRKAWFMSPVFVTVANDPSCQGQRMKNRPTLKWSCHFVIQFWSQALDKSWHKICLRSFVPIMLVKLIWDMDSRINLCQTNYIWTYKTINRRSSLS